jgi:PAS domain S-box-containing protein
MTGLALLLPAATSAAPADAALTPAGGGPVLWALVITLGAQAVLIAALLWQRARLRKNARNLSCEQDLNRAILHASVSFFLVTDRAGRIRVTNDALCRRLGYAGSALTGLPFIDTLVHPEDRKEARDHFAQSLIDGLSHRGETRLVTRAGETIEVAWEGGFVGNDLALLTGIDISDQRRTERELQEIRERYRLALEGSGVDVWDLHMADWTAHIEARVPGTGERIRRSVSPSIVARDIHPHDLPAVRVLLDAHIDGKTPSFEVEYRLRSGPDSYRWMLARGRVVERDTNGKPVRMSGTQLDIHDRREAEWALRLREERYDLAVRAGRIGVWDWELDTDMVNIDPHMLELLGRVDESSRQRSADFVNWAHPEDFPRMAKDIGEVLAGRSDRLAGKFQMQCADGSFRWFLADSQCVRDDQGKVTRLVGTTVDITDLEESRRDLRVSEKRYRELVGHMSSGVAVFVPDDSGDDFIFREFNHAAEWMERTSRVQVVGRSLLACFPWAEESGLLGMLRRVRVSGEPELLRSARHHDRHMECWRDYYVYELPAGELVAVFDDVTHRIRAEDALRDSERRLRAFFEAAHDIAFLKDREGRFLMVNPSMSALFGMSPEELRGKRATDFWTGEDAGIIRDTDERALRGESVQYELRFGQGDARRVLDMSKVPLRDEAGRVTGVCVIARDITMRRRAEHEARVREQQLIQADKLVSLGTLVAGVAHEINNPNSMIKLALPILRAACRDAGPVLDAYFRENGDFNLGGLPYSEVRGHLPRLLLEMGESTERISRILGELRDFALQQPTPQHEQVDMNAVVRSSVTLVGNLIGKSTRAFEAVYAPGLPPVEGHFQRLEQVVVNLLVNACQAMGYDDDGIRVWTAHDPARKRVTVCVRDNGRGIPPGDLPRLTDPFFTTRREEGGTGLGLSVSSRIVAEHEGSLAFDSAPGRGTTVTLSLPVSGGTPP